MLPSHNDFLFPCILDLLLFLTIGFECNRNYIYLFRFGMCRIDTAKHPNIRPVSNLYFDRAEIASRKSFNTRRLMRNDHNTVHA